MKHGGNIYQFAELIGCLPEQVLDFSANINPQQAVELTCLQRVQLGPYADPEYSLLKQAIKRRYPAPDNADIEVFNGASAAIFALLRRLQAAERIYPGQANFLLAQLADGGDGYHLQTQWQTSRILIRVCDNFEGLDKSRLRFAVKNREAIDQLALSLKILSLKTNCESGYSRYYAFEKK